MSPRGVIRLLLPTSDRPKHERVGRGLVRSSYVKGFGLAATSWLRVDGV